MAREPKANSEQFDIDGLRQLLELMEHHDVRVLKLHRGDVRYVLRRGPQEVVTVSPGAISGVSVAAAPATSPVVGTPPTAVDEGVVPIKSPTVGTFYQSASPGEPVFVKVGDTVKADTVVCIVEAMKVFNQIPAGMAGTISKVLLNDGDPVEFGQTLFLVKPH